MFKLLSVTVLLLAPLAAFAQSVATQCETYTFQCNWHIYQCGAELAFPTMTNDPDACGIGNWPTYRPMTASDCAKLIDTVKTANYTGTGLPLSKIRCRETHLSQGTNGFGWGDALTSWGCYNGTTNTSLMMSTATVQTTCRKDRSLFTKRDAFIGRDQKCGCGTSNPADCVGVVAGSQCEPGLHCVPTSTSHSMCKFDPKSDHTCCHSLNHLADDVQPGTCCPGNRAENWKCVRGLENRSIAYTGICNSSSAERVRKSAIMEGNVCFETPDTVNKTRAVGHQGDCMIGLKCDGEKGFGSCQWWDNPLYKNSSNLARYTRGCEAGDCQGTLK
jgi:hypothetical protein